LTSVSLDVPTVSKGKDSYTKLIIGTSDCHVLLAPSGAILNYYQWFIFLRHTHTQ